MREYVIQPRFVLWLNENQILDKKIPRGKRKFFLNNLHTKLDSLDDVSTQVSFVWRRENESWTEAAAVETAEMESTIRYIWLNVTGWIQTVYMDQYLVMLFLFRNQIWIQIIKIPKPIR